MKKTLAFSVIALFVSMFSASVSNAAVSCEDAEKTLKQIFFQMNSYGAMAQDLAKDSAQANDGAKASIPVSSDFEMLLVRLKNNSKGFGQVMIRSSEDAIKQYQYYKANCIKAKK